MSASDPPAALPSAPARNSRASALPVSSKNWDRHVDHVEQMADSPGFQALRDLILRLAQLSTGDRLLDVGAGTGLLAQTAARDVARVIALDGSPAMCRHLERKFARLELANAEALLGDATDLPLSDNEIDVVVSNYCLHHLSDADKGRALVEIRRVLRPGGRLVFADMMFRIGIANRRDRSVIALMVKRMLRHGPSGAIRLLKNGMRIASGRWEHPAGVEWWRKALLDLGFTDVTVFALEHEGGIAFARKPVIVHSP
jgi:ubiquinone/menaquinone biosynthesis C-methylase UbiE